MRPNIQALIDQLNAQQRQAVEHRGGPVLVLAGAGSGKTRVITVRIAHFIGVSELDPGRILALTFTNKAAGEMKDRVAHLCGAEASSRVTVGTFHALGLRMVDEEARALGYKRRFTLLDAADQARFIRHGLRELRLDPQRHDPQTFLTAISNARNLGITAQQLIDDPRTRTTGRVYQTYIDRLHAYRAIDFDDLILKPIELLTQHPEIRDKWRRRFQTVLVDEYQDTNGAQFELVRLLTEEHRSLCVVGDDDQSIYGWRGARLENILSFETHFNDATVIRLEQNYRSTGHILDAANAVIARNTARKKKQLWTASGKGEPVHVVACKDARAEANFVAAEIVRRANVESWPWRSFGVLFRTSAQAQALTDALRLSSVPYKLVGASDFYERKEIKDTLSYLRLVDHREDRGAMLRVINFPQRGIGPRSLEKLYDFAEAHQLPMDEALTQAASIPGLTRKAAEGMKEFQRVLENAQAFWHEHKDLAATGRLIIQQTRAREAWIRSPTEGPGGKARWANVSRLLESMEHYQRRKPSTTLRDYLRVVALDKHHASEAAEQADEVTLMTLHAAKGLEWPASFVVGCQEGLLPHQRTIQDGGDVSEERRLFYVGITRAKRYCYLTYAKLKRKFQGTEPARPSRFLRDIPKHHRLDIDRAKVGGDGGAVAKKETKKRFAELQDLLRRG